MSNPYISPPEAKKLNRKILPLPAFISKALKANNVASKYSSRPAYQKNDYVAWIMRAKRDETRQKRLEQMISELQGGTKYMKMNYSGEK